MAQDARKIWSLYRITNLVNGKVYIGQAEDYQHRWADHRRAVRLNKPTQAVHYAMIKYGLDNFAFEVIASCRTQDDANEIETVLVAQYDSFIKSGKGYNATLGGMNAPKSEAWKQTMRDHWADPEYKTRVSEAISEAHQAKTPEEKAEQIAKIMATKSTWTEEFREDYSRRIAKALTGIPQTEERRQKQRGSRPNFVPWNKGLVLVPKKPKSPPKINAGRFVATIRWPEDQELVGLVNQHGMTATAKMLGTKLTNVSKRITRHKLKDKLSI